LGVGRVGGEGDVFVPRGGFGGGLKGKVGSRSIVGNFLKGGFAGGENFSEKYLDFKKRLGEGSAKKKGLKRGVSNGNFDCRKFDIEAKGDYSRANVGGGTGRLNYSEAGIRSSNPITPVKGGRFDEPRISPEARDLSAIVTNMSIVNPMIYNGKKGILSEARHVSRKIGALGIRVRDYGECAQIKAKYGYVDKSICDRGSWGAKDKEMGLTPNNRLESKEERNLDVTVPVKKVTDSTGGSVKMNYTLDMNGPIADRQSTSVFTETPKSEFPDPIDRPGIDNDGSRPMLLSKCFKAQSLKKNSPVSQIKDLAIGDLNDSIDKLLQKSVNYAFAKKIDKLKTEPSTDNV
jgi:hypothetical protein